MPDYMPMYNSAIQLSEEENALALLKYEKFLTDDERSIIYNWTQELLQKMEQWMEAWEKSGFSADLGVYRMVENMYDWILEMR